MSNTYHTTDTLSTAHHSKFLNLPINYCMEISNRLIKFVQQTSLYVYLEGTMEKAMATHSSTLAWKIPWTEESGRLQSMRSLRIGHNRATSLSLFHFHALEKEMATHCCVLAWRIPGTGEPGGLPSMGSHRVGHD